MDWSPDQLVARYLPFVESFVVDFVSAIVVLIIGWTISNIVSKTILRLGNTKRNVDTTALPMISSFLQWIIRILTFVVVLSQFGVQTASIIAALGAAGVAIGLALQGTLQNIAAGIMLLSLRPLSQGEFVNVGDKFLGTVEEIGLFLTRLRQTNGVKLTIPNSVVWNSTIINFSRNESRRIDLPVAIQYGEDMDEAIQVLTDLVAQHELVLQDQPHQVFVSEYQENGLVLTVRVWVAAGSYADSLATIMLDVRKALEASGFQVPIRKVAQINVDPSAFTPESDLGNPKQIS